MQNQNKNQATNMGDMRKATELYETIYKEISSKLDELVEIQKSFPVKISKDISYENLILQAASCKHRALALSRDCLAVTASANIDLKYWQSYVLLDKSDELLRDKGFDKFTDTLRQAAMANNEYLREFAKVEAKLNGLEETSTRLFKAFESDEINFRKMYDKHEYKGL